jgi:hypothetical protein
MHYLHTLAAERFAFNDTKQGLEYRDNARESWDKIGNAENKLSDTTEEIRNKQIECNNMNKHLTNLTAPVFIGYLVLFFVTLKIFSKTKE